MTKLDVLRTVAITLNQENVSWAIGGSLLLMFKGYTDSFNDIDLLVDSKDIEKVIQCLRKLGTQVKAETKAPFLTKHFHKFLVEGVELDVMADFGISHQGVNYHFPLAKEKIETIDFLGVSLPLHSVLEWQTYYRLMSREDKVKLIEEGCQKGK